MGKNMYSCAVLLPIILLFVEFAICCLAQNATSGCIAGERKALMKFKASLSDPSNRLSSWDGEDCCAWHGVTCDKVTGHVIKLDLRPGNITEFYDFKTRNHDKMLQGQIVDSSLLELKHLSYLDLSCNDFQDSTIPAFLGSMKQLRYLNLSNGNFVGVVPHHIGNLSSLRVLDLGGSASSLVVDDLEWTINLSSLELLDMSYVYLNRIKDLFKVLSLLPSLIVLRMQYCELDNTNLPSHFLWNSTAFTNVQHLDLSRNSFEGELPYFLQNMTSLRFLDLSHNNYHSSHFLRNSMAFTNVRHLDLSWNSFHGELPYFLHNMTSLRFLDLSWNFYNSSDPHVLIRLRNLFHLNLADNSFHHKADWISEFMWDKCHLKSLDLSYNKFHGDISGAFKNLSRCWSDNLESLILRGNTFYGHLSEELGEFRQLMYLDLLDINISGPIPTSLGKLSALTELDISSNQLFGQIPSSLENLKALRSLTLSNNQLSGEIPISLGQLSDIESIDLSSNSFNGTLSEAHFAKLSKLEYLILNSNLLKFRVGYDWVPPFQLKKLSMGSCKIEGQFPPWLKSQKALFGLDLSNCSITGTLPKWLHSINLYTLDLSHNHINGPIPELASSMRFLDLSDNMINHLPTNIGHMLPLLNNMLLAQNFINGSMPDSLCEMGALQTLDLSKNHLSGNLPNCWSNFSSLRTVRLSSNDLSGVIPNSIGGSYLLSWLQLNNNSFVGALPSTLKNCTWLSVLDVGDNKLSGNLPEWIGKHLLWLVALRLRSNEFDGAIPSVFCQLSELQVMDLANNKLTGKIPHCFGNFSGMVKMHMVRKESSCNYRDLCSRRKLAGESLSQVVKGLAREYTTTLRYLVNLDLSSNHLVGEIPSELTSLFGLIGLNLSYNHLGGSIPKKIGEMKSLESLDLSNNNLIGRIPDSLSRLIFLSYLNLSNNNLSGLIPTGPQLQTLNDPSIYDGNPELCGAPLPRECHNNDATKAPPNVETHAAGENRDTADKVCFYSFIIGGFATGFWGVIGILVLKTR